MPLTIKEIDGAKPIGKPYKLADGGGLCLLIAASGAKLWRWRFRFDGKEVRIRRHGNQVILEPIADDWAWLDALVGEFDDDFIAAINEQPPQQERPELDELFR